MKDDPFMRTNNTKIKWKTCFLPTHFAWGKFLLIAAQMNIGWYSGTDERTEGDFFSLIAHPSAVTTI